MRETVWTTYLCQGVTRGRWIWYTISKTLWNTSSISTTVLRQPQSQAVFGFHAADVTSAVIGNGDYSREAWDMGQKLPPWVTQETSYMLHGPSWEADSRSAGQEFFCPL
jgi:hypothetical protein